MEGHVEAETRPQEEESWPPGWYREREVESMRFWDGERWTDARAPLEVEDAVRGNREVLSALALGFAGVAAASSLWGIPVLLFVVPLGFGIAAAALCVAAMTVPGYTPWWLAVAVLGALAGIVTGIDGYNEFSDASESLDDLRDSFR